MRSCTCAQFGTQSLTRGLRRRFGRGSRSRRAVCRDLGGPTCNVWSLPAEAFRSPSPRACLLAIPIPIRSDVGPSRTVRLKLAVFFLPPSSQNTTTSIMYCLRGPFVRLQLPQGIYLRQWSDSAVAVAFLRNWTSRSPLALAILRIYRQLLHEWGIGIWAFRLA